VKIDGDENTKGKSMYIYSRLADGKAKRQLNSYILRRKNMKN